MNALILYDQKSSVSGYHTGWGFSCLIDKRILFDTGGKNDALLRNLKESGRKPSDIKAVVISHDHLDHTGGLWPLLKEIPGIKVYVCLHSKPGLKKKIEKYGGAVVEVGNPTKIAPGIYSTGEQYTKYKEKPLVEHALMISARKGLSLIAGCAHPGVVNLINRARQEFPSKPLYIAMGGFHLKDKSRGVIRRTVKRVKELGLRKVAPLHCSGQPAESEFRKCYGDDCVGVRVGQEISL